MNGVMREDLSWDNILIMVIGLGFIVLGLAVGFRDEETTIWGFQMEPVYASTVLILLGMVYIVYGRRREKTAGSSERESDQ